MRTVVLRQRAKQRMYSGLERSFGAASASGARHASFLFSNVLGPQLSLLFSLGPPRPAASPRAPHASPQRHQQPPPQPANLQIEVLPSLSYPAQWMSMPLA